jgi:hypothetical protein
MGSLLKRLFGAFFVGGTICEINIFVATVATARVQHTYTQRRKI